MNSMTVRIGAWIKQTIANDVKNRRIRFGLITCWNSENQTHWSDLKWNSISLIFQPEGRKQGWYWTGRLCILRSPLQRIEVGKRRPCDAKTELNAQQKISITPRLKAKVAVIYYMGLFTQRHLSSIHPLFIKVSHKELTTTQRAILWAYE